MIDNTNLICPICHNKLKLENKSLKCIKNHTYDVAKQGYVNLIPSQKPINYSKELFLNRKIIFTKGYYEKVANKIFNIISKFQSEYKEVASSGKINILDVGCGEGYYSGYIKKQNNDLNLFGFDIVKEAINLASKNYKDCNFLIADLANIPFENDSFDIILDVLTPSNYKEFKRIMKDDAIVIKIIPNVDYLIELRNLFKDQLKNKRLENVDVIELFNKQFNHVETLDINYKVTCDEEDIKSFIEMTPMLIGVDKEKISKELLKEINEITIDFKILIGKLN